ncbi:unnamed protein product [Amoebophrya sp. A25]|nr:unnamed protein product [Amoebophrya sp. A25]|eukprot:GSA25T00022350001.1
MGAVFSKSLKLGLSRVSGVKLVKLGILTGVAAFTTLQRNREFLEARPVPHKEVKQKGANDGPGRQAGGPSTPIKPKPPAAKRDPSKLPGQKVQNFRRKKYFPSPEAKQGSGGVQEKNADKEPTSVTSTSSPSSPTSTALPTTPSRESSSPSLSSIASASPATTPSKEISSPPLSSAPSTLFSTPALALHSYHPGGTNGDSAAANGKVTGDTGVTISLELR